MDDPARMPGRPCGHVSPAVTKRAPARHERPRPVGLMNEAGKGKEAVVQILLAEADLAVDQ